MKSTISQTMNIKPQRLKNLLRDLVDIYSPSGKEEEVIEFAEQYLKKHGLVVNKQEVDENRFNLIAFPEGKDVLGLLLCIERYFSSHLIFLVILAKHGVFQYLLVL